MRNRKLGIGIIIIISILVLGCSKETPFYSIEDNPLLINPIAYSADSDTKQNTNETEHNRKSEDHSGNHSEDPQFTLEYISNPGRMIKPHDHYEEFSYYQLPLTENQFHIRFTKPMNQQSVESTINERLGSEVNAQFVWSDAQNLTLDMEGAVSDENHVLSLSGALDTDGQRVQTHSELHFTFVQPKAFYTFDLQSNTEKLLYEPNMAIDHASLRRNKDYVRISDQIGIFFAPYYDYYLLNLTSFAWNHWRSPAYEAVDLANEEYRNRYMYYVHFLESVFAIEDQKEIDFKEDHSGLLFSPNADKVAVFTTDQSLTPFVEGVRYAIDLTTYDVEGGQLIRTYRGLYHDIMEADGTDAPPDGRYLHYKSTYAYWFAEDQILIEYLSEDESEMRIGILHLASGVFKTITAGMINPIISTTGTHFVAIDWEQKDSKVFDLEGNVVATLTTANEHVPIWSDSGDRLVYKDIDGFIKIYNVPSNTSTSLANKMDVAGWLDENTLLIYK